MHSSQLRRTLYHASAECSGLPALLLLASGRRNIATRLVNVGAKPRLLMLLGE